jgi:hypothetical protein
MAIDSEKTKLDLLSQSTPTAGLKVMQAISKDPDSTFNNLNEAKAAAPDINKEEQKEKTSAAQAGVNYLNAVQQGKAEMPDQTVLQNIMASNLSAPEPPSYEATADKKQVEKDITKQYTNDIFYSPQATMEKLGVQDYYPNIGQDIGVGTYSGSRLGSATIFASQGTLIPMGLIDARKRALASAAQEKQKAINKVLEFADAPEQFDNEYKQYAIKTMYDHLEKNNYNMSSFYKDREAVGDLYRLQSLAKDLKNTDAVVDQLFSEASSNNGGTGKYLPEEVGDFVAKYRSAKVENFDDILSGKTKVSEYLDGLQGYANGTKWADDRLAEWTSDPTEVPINLKTNKPLNEANIAEIKDAIAKVRGGNGYDQWQTVKKKYFSLDVENTVDNWAKINLPEGDPSPEWIKKYIEAQIPEDSFIQAVERQGNDNFAYWNAKFQRANEVEDQRKTYYQQMVETAQNANISGALTSLRPQFAAIDKMKNADGSNLSEDQKRQRKQDLLAEQMQGKGFGFVVKDPNSKNLVYGVTNIDAKNSAAFAVGENAKIMVKDKNGKVDKVFISEIRKNPNKYALTSNQKSFLENYDKVVMKDYEHRTTPGYTDGDGNIRRVTTDNLGAYEKNKQIFITEAIGKPYVQETNSDKTLKYDAQTGKPVYKELSDITIYREGNTIDEGFKSGLDAAVGYRTQSYVGGTSQEAYKEGKK